MDQSSQLPQEVVSNLAHDLGDVHISRTTDILLTENVDFKGLLLPDYILKGLNAARFQRPSPIQMRAIPLLRLGLDLIVQGKSGTGKTLIIGIAALETVKIEVPRVQVVIVAPTREIALQIRDFINTMSQGQPGLKAEAFVGGLSKAEDRKNLIGCHIAIGTPGRLLDLLKSKYLLLKSVRLLVMDEADKLMEKEIFGQVRSICKQLPANKQTILCSATFLNPLQEYVACQMKEPFWVSSEGATRLRDGKLQPHSSVPLVLLGVKQFLKELPSCPNVNKLLQLKLDEILNILSHVGFSQCLVFSNYQTRAETICNHLIANGWPALSIRGQDEQSLRMAAISALKEFRCRVLLTTDVTSRGIDIKGVDLVINLDIPYDSATYLHRTGRAGRFGSHGAVITLATKGKEITAFKKIIADVPDIQVFFLPDNMQIRTSDNLAFERVSFAASEAEVCHPILDGNEEDIRHNRVDLDHQNSLSGVNRDCNGEKLKCAVEEAKVHLSAVLCSPHSLRKGPLKSYEELENMLNSWVPEEGCKLPAVHEKYGISHQDWWTSAGIVLFDSDRELQQIMDIKCKSVSRDQCSDNEHEKNCDSIIKTPDSNLAYRSQWRKHKDNHRKFKTSCNKNNVFEAEGNVDWSWDCDWNLYFTWDSSHDCCYFFNPWTQVFYKWESDVFFKWNEEFSLYEVWNPNSNSFVECSAASKQAQSSAELNVNVNLPPLNKQDRQYWNWFVLWNKQMKQMCSYVQYVEYFNTMYKQLKRPHK